MHIYAIHNASQDTIILFEVLRKIMHNETNFTHPISLITELLW